MSAKKSRQRPPEACRKRAILDMLRDARATVYRDAESFNESAAVLEHVGQMLCNVVQNGLNGSGDYIRHHAVRLVELFLVLEEGLSMSAKVAGDLMVENPTTAELWHNIATIRRAMLVNAFSYLPVQDGSGVWKLLSDASVVKYLRGASTAKDRSEMLGKPLHKLLEGRGIELTVCSRFSEDKNIEDVSKAVTHVPVLIIEKVGNKERLLGILSAFDLI